MQILMEFNRWMEECTIIAALSFTLVIKNGKLIAGAYRKAIKDQTEQVTDW